jgi:hypothetical protein
MKHQIRKVEEITIWRATNVVELDDKKFKKLSEDPYTGTTAEDFANYLADKNFEELSLIMEDICPKTAQALMDIVESPWEEYASSLDKYSNIHIQIGEKDEAYRKSGGFRVDEDVQSR